MTAYGKLSSVFFGYDLPAHAYRKQINLRNKKHEPLYETTTLPNMNSYPYNFIVIHTFYYYELR